MTNRGADWLERVQDENRLAILAVLFDGSTLLWRPYGCYAQRQKGGNIVQLVEPGWCADRAVCEPRIYSSPVIARASMAEGIILCTGRVLPVLPS